MLELPRSAAGRMAKCPACEATFPAVAADTHAAPTELHASPPQHPETQPAEPSSPLSNPYAASSQNPYSQPLGGSGSAINPPPQLAPVNPYRPAEETPTPVAQVGRLTIVSRSIENIFSPTFPIFSQRWGSMVPAVILVLFVSFAILIVTTIVDVAIRDAADGIVAAGISLIMNIGGYLVSSYLYLGLTRNAIAVARNEPAPFSFVFPPLGIYLRFLAGGLLLMLAFVVVATVIGGAIAVIATLGAGQELIAVALIAAAVLLLPAMFVAWWLLWSWPFIVSDDKGTAIGSMRAAYAITMNNKATSLLLLLVTGALSTAGMLACYIGTIITTPLTLLMMAIGYLLITNQEIEDPRSRLFFRPENHEPPKNPSF